MIRWVEWVGADGAGQARKLLQEQEDATSGAVSLEKLVGGPFYRCMTCPLHGSEISLYLDASMIRCNWTGGRQTVACCI